MQITTIGLDIAKNVFQVHGIDAKEKVVVRKQLRRSQVIAFFAALPPCLIGRNGAFDPNMPRRQDRRANFQKSGLPDVGTAVSFPA